MLIAARNGFLAGGKLSAKSYIQDGLVAMWDGIENAEWGTHDANATVWKDLVGNLDVPIRAGGYWLDDAASNVGSSSAQLASLFTTNEVLSTVKTFELVVDISNLSELIFSFSHNGIGYGLFCSKYDNKALLSATTSNGQVWCFTRGMSGYDDTRWRGKSAVSVSYDADMIPIKATLNGMSQSVLSDIGRTTTIHNRYIAVLSAFDSSTGASRGSCHSIRLYSRTLTADEIAANYAVDKARFNLP